jgi:hypothetical protein
MWLLMASVHAGVTSRIQPPSFDRIIVTSCDKSEPACRFIFVQPVMSGSASLTQTLAGTSGAALDFQKLEPLKRLSGFSSVAWDVANEAIDPHAVGMAIKQVKPSKGR